MAEIKEYVEKLSHNFSKLPSFANTINKTTLKDSISKAFAILGYPIDPFFSREAILDLSGKYKIWNQMLYFCDENKCTVAFISEITKDDTIFVDCYGNFFKSEQDFIHSKGVTKFRRYYSNEYTICEADDAKYFTSIINALIQFGYVEASLLLQKFKEVCKEKFCMALKTLKIIHPFFCELSTKLCNILFLNGNSLCIELIESVATKNIIIEVNIERLSSLTAFKMFSKVLCRKVVDDNPIITKNHLRKWLIKEKNIEAIERYICEINKNFCDVETAKSCHDFADKIYQEIKKSKPWLTEFRLSQLKNIVLWLKFRRELDFVRPQEIIDEYCYLFDKIQEFKPKKFIFKDSFTAILHIYKHFYALTKTQLFKNCKQAPNLNFFKEDTENIIGILTRLIKKMKILSNSVYENNMHINKYHGLLQKCFNFYFDVVSEEIIKEPNYIFSYISGDYKSYYYEKNDLVGTLYNFVNNEKKESKKFIATLHLFDENFYFPFE